MQRSKLILTALALALVVVLYLLPKVVVDNEQRENANTIGESSDTEVDESHDRQLADQDAAVIAELKDGFGPGENPEKNAIFADSLGSLFASLNFLDSAAFYYGMAADLEPGLDRRLKAGEGYYEAYSFAVESQKQQKLGEQARKYFNLALEEDPGLHQVKAKMAMTYLPGQPMQAVMLLREVVEQDPNNELGLYNLGLLSLQSQQFDKAVERFQALTSSHPENLEGQFYLGVSYFENGEQAKAREQFEKVKKMNTDPEVHVTIDEYLDQLK